MEREREDSLAWLAQTHIHMLRSYNLPKSLLYNGTNQCPDVRMAANPTID